MIISPANLDKPENLVTIGKISEQVNSLTCTASNAETVEWVYLDEANSQTYKVVSNNVWTVLPPDTDGDTGDVSRTITDQGMTNNAERSDQTGYYKCIAKTSVNGNDYVTTTPPIRFISPGENFNDILATRSLSQLFDLKKAFQNCSHNASVV